MDPIKSPPDMDYKNMKTNLNSFNNWKTKALKNPYMEIQIDRAPLYLCSHRNYLFLVDDKEKLSIFLSFFSMVIEIS